jgi:two-component system LytT family response regulator
MAQIEAKLPTERFMRVHRSIIVNTERVREVQPWFKGDYVLIMHDGTKLRSGRTYRQSVQALID